MKKQVSDDLILSFLCSLKILKFLFPAVHKLESGLLFVIVFGIKDFSGSSLLLPLDFSFFLISELFALR